MAATDIGRVVGGSWPAQPTIGQDGIRTLGIMSTWPQGRSLHGGVDEIPLPPAAGGRLWLSGKHFIGPDPEAALRRIGATAIVCLTEPAELIDRYPAYVDWLRANQPARALWWPVPDLHVPDLDDAIDLLVHCGAGIGRAGTIAAALLITFGFSQAAAVAHVAAHRPMAGPEAGAQTDLLHALSSRDSGRW